MKKSAAKSVATTWFEKP